MLLKKKWKSGTRIVLTLTVAALAGGLFQYLKVPLPWMLGPLLVVGGLSMSGMPVQSWHIGRNAGQWLLGTSLGLFFTPAVVLVVWQMTWAIGLSVLWAVLLGLGAGSLLLHWQRARIPDLDWRTTFLAGSVGGASEMTSMAERTGARTDLVAGAHSLRMLIVTLTMPLTVQWLDLAGSSVVVTNPVAAPILMTSIVGMSGIATLLGGWLMCRWKVTNPWFLGSLFVAIALAALELGPNALPRWLVNLAQLLIGVSLGVRFTPQFIKLAPSWLAAVTTVTFLMIISSAGFATLLTFVSGQPLVTTLLATAPGGIGEMSITAQVLNAGAPVVVAFQVTRLAVVLTCCPLMMKWREAWFR